MFILWSERDLLLAASPPHYYLPDNKGVEVISGGVRGRVDVNFGRAIPKGMSFHIMVERLLDDYAWQDDTSVDLMTGLHKNMGPAVTFNFVNFAIRAKRGRNKLVGQYPTRWRIRVDSADAWTLPFIALSVL